MAAKTGNSYTTGTVTDWLKIPTANMQLAVFDYVQLEETDQGRLRQLNKKYYFKH